MLSIGDLETRSAIEDSARETGGIRNLEVGQGESGSSVDGFYFLFGPATQPNENGSISQLTKRSATRVQRYTVLLIVM